MLTIGSATTKSDRKLYKLGQNTCCKIQLAGSTNGLARLFYLNDRWVSYIDIHSITTLRAFRSIHEGTYRKDESTRFDHLHKTAEVRVMNKQTKVFELRKIYKTPEHIRDVVAGFMMIRLVDLSKYRSGDRITIDGFYEDTGYKIDVIMGGRETIKTEYGNMLCYRVKPIVPKNKVFDGVDAVDVWLSTNPAQYIVSVRARLRLGELWIELE